MHSLSVIVPIYNRQNYLRRCIDSLLLQSYVDLQIILVNDGSTDDSGRICNEYTDHNSHIVVVHQKNQGVAAARRSGFSVATGEYVAFVDSDDWVDSDMYSILMDEAMKTQADRVFCDYYEDTERGTRVNKSMFDENPNKMLAWVLANQTPHFVWDGIFKREIVKRTFDECIDRRSLAEDLFFNVVALCFQPKLAQIALPLYHYNKSDHDSLVHDYDVMYESRSYIDATYQFLASRDLAKYYLSILFFTPLRVKMGLLNQGKLDEAINLFSYSNSIREFYGFLPLYLRWIYWGVFNWGSIGKVIYGLYVKAKTIES